MAGRRKIAKAPAQGTVPTRGSRAKARGGASSPVSPPRAGLPRDYAETLGEIKQRIQQERLRVVLAANSAMVLLYWDIGRMILDRQERAGWGARVIDRLAADLREAFPDMRGFSPRNLKYMRAFAAAWRERRIVQEVLAQITWYHNVTLIEKLDAEPDRLWYARQVVEQGWSRNILALQIEGRAHARHGKAVSFYHLKLRCFVVVELKAVPFNPAFVGQLNLYLSAVDDLLRHPDDKPTIGLLLCREKNRLVVEYALRHLQRPIGVAQWEIRLVEELPKEMKGSLPTVEEIEAELAKPAGRRA